MAHHGNTPAAWMGVLVILVGFLVAGIGLVTQLLVMFWIGVGIAVVGPIVGKVMQKLGLGSEPVEQRRH